jgi:hypothetical protein
MTLLHAAATATALDETARPISAAEVIEDVLEDVHVALFKQLVCGACNWLSAAASAA